MRVVGVGFGRTGTSSMKLALERLGFGPCYHMSEVMGDASRRRTWAHVFAGAQPDWDTVFAGYDATVDWPAAAYWRELVDAYPDAKVLLTVRDPQRWYDSMEQTILAQMAGAESGPGKLAFKALGLINPELPAFFDGLKATVGTGTFGGVIDRDHGVEAFERHTREVQAYVPADRLLTYEVKQGWEPLCEFLGVPVPDEEFPRVNDAGDFQRGAQEMVFGDLRRTALRTAAVVGTLAAGALAFRALRRRR